MGKSVSDYIVPAALGATGFGLAGMGPLSFLGGGAAEGAAGGLLGAAPGTLETMGGLEFINGVPQTMGAKMSALGSGFMPGEWDWMKSGKMGIEGLKMLQGEEPQQQQQSMPQPATVQHPQSYPQASFLDIIRANNDRYFRGQ